MVLYQTIDNEQHSKAYIRVQYAKYTNGDVVIMQFNIEKTFDTIE